MRPLERFRVSRVLPRLIPACLLAALALSGAACAGGSGGGAGGAASAATSTPSTQGSIRMIGLDRRALSPGAAPRLLLVAERPAGADPASYRLEESADGVAWRPASAPPPAALPRAVAFDLPMPLVAQYFRLVAPAASNRVRASAPGPAAAGPSLSWPAPGASAIARRPALILDPASAAARPAMGTFLYAIADEEGTLRWLAESLSSALAPGDPGARTLIEPPAGGLAPQAAHLALVLALDEEAFGSAVPPRADFTTGP
jgi:hypothetical protein